MPMSGGTRMLRARRKDCNVKPNRRLDRKSSRGMLFENEELRMRTITINAEVEQGQHALKKLRRENEQLRREMWCLRDEYDKMEKLLRKREEGEESDQENSDSDDNYRTDESEDEKREPGNGENVEKSPELENEADVRTFDGLSVIDEQTEETQTTESVAGCGSISRGNSANRTFNHQDRIPEFFPCGYNFDSCEGKFQTKKKELDSCEGYLDAWDDTYDGRPASPYPYNGSFRPSYQKRFRLLQELPVMPQTPPNAIGDSGWIFPDPSKIPNYNVYVEDPVALRENYISDKPHEGSSFGYDLMQERGGPDVFVTGGYPRVNSDVIKVSGPVREIEENVVEGARGNVIDDVEAEIDKIEISGKSETDPKTQKMTLTKSAVSRGGTRGEPHETLDPGKLTMDESVDKNDNEISIHAQQLVTCQNPNGQQVRETIEPDEMPQTEKPGNSKYQTKLMVTLKSPAGGKVPKKVLGPVPPRTFQPQLRYGIKPEHAMSQRFQTFPSPGLQSNARTPASNGRGHSANGHPGVPVPGLLSGSLPAVTKCDVGFNSSNIPDDFDKELDVLPDEEALPEPVTQSSVKPVKIPPVPPPRTSSCPKQIIPPPPVGVTALRQRNFRKGKRLQQDSTNTPMETPLNNPLLMSQPIATSSPTISLKGYKGPTTSTENLYCSKFRKQSYNEDSSLDEYTKSKFKLKDDPNRSNVPKLNKSLSSPSFGSFRTLRRKQSEVTTASMENILAQKSPEAIGLSEKPEQKISKGHTSPNNASVSSSSGLDSPTKNDRRKRRVSIQFKKKQSQSEGKRVEDEGGGKDSTDSRRDSTAPGNLSAKTSHKAKGKNEETDATTSERERTNSVSSRTSSLMAGSRRKYSFSSNKTYLNDEKIPWCGCWGNGCV